uniref:Conserved hypothetical plastid protein n=1 Tax=Mastocarpus papillatus TaxID=31436 RepID=A0A342RZP9_9FLOR|nr:conserved hypothetical plastid protein [Mastocarpus papillatus]AOL58195.1 conserved hypothetical plastid protein [Mastocarpus papillatus]
MSFFNLMLIRNLFNSNLVIQNQLPSVNITLNQNPLAYDNSNNKTNKSNILYVVGSKNDSLNISINSLGQKKLLSRHFIIKLFNKYWQETIFLSQPSLTSDYYSNKLKSDGISVYKNRYRKFLFDFSKALIAGRIEANLDKAIEIDTINNNTTEIKYTWRKGLNFSLPTNFSNLLYYKRQLNFPNPYQLALMKKLQQNKLPVFAVINNFNQVIVAQPPDELISKKSLTDQIYQFYYDCFLLEKDHKTAYEGLFFINSQDAIEYKEYIYNNYRNSSKYMNLNIFATGLDFYYKLVRTSTSKVQFHLIPDLKELGNLIYKYQYNKNIAFHNHQKRGKYSFKGQPIYLIQPVLSKNKQTKETSLVNYTYELAQNGKKQVYEAVFMNYEVALLAWNKFIQQNNNYRLPVKPNILIYNLEDFLKFHEDENSNNIDKKNFLFIPTKESYEFIKDNISKASQRYFPHTFHSQFLRFQIITKRIIWSLTSRQPINW